MMKSTRETSRQINIPYLLKIGEGKIFKIGKYLFDKDMLDIAVFWGEGTENIVGNDFYNGIKAQGINIVYSQVVNDISIENITHTAFSLPPKIKAIVGIGGGKALDYAKYTAYLLRLPYVAVPTIVSNDGFCSPTVSMTVDGARKTVKSSIPYGVVIDLDVIKNSPVITIYSGLGDMISKVTALWDWKMSFNKGFERYNDFASMISYNSLDLLFLRHSSNIDAQQFRRSLATSLLYSGVAMEIAGTSRPASGSEHLVSHALDKISTSPKMHGLQVGTATYLCALLQGNDMIDGVRDFFESTGFFDIVREKPFDKREFVEALKIAPLIKQDYYTILSEEDSFARAVKFIEEDKILKSLII